MKVADRMKEQHKNLIKATKKRNMNEWNIVYL